MHELRRARPLLGTLVEIQARAPFALPRLHAAIDAAFAVIGQVHALMSAHEPASDVGRLNCQLPGAAPLSINPHTAAVLRAAQGFSRRSAGAFDITMAPRLERWGYLTPGLTPIDETADWRAIELLPGSRVRLRRAVRIDLGGIAKGYAVDRAIDTLTSAGVDCALVNAGGDLRTTGPRTRNVGLRHPLDPSRIGATVRLQGAALASSSACFSRRSLPTGPVSALLDPRSGQAFIGGGSVSVIAPECLVADALTKVVLFASAGVCRNLLRACGARALVLPAADWPSADRAA